ncbi:MAG: amidohydrolase family protein [Candidatus Binataceae bacterium]
MPPPSDEYDEDEEQPSPGRIARLLSFLPTLSRGARIVRNILVVIAILGVAAWLTIRFSLKPPRPLETPERSFVLTGVTIVNPGLNRLKGKTLVVKDGRILKVEDVAPADAGIVAARYAGYYVLPGLIDMHVHTPPLPANVDRQFFYLQYLVNGVTTIRDMGNSGFLLRDRAETAEGKVAGPRIFTCGPYLDGDPPVWEFSRVVRNQADADRIVDRLATHGADFVKVYDRLTPEALAAIESAARRHNLPVAGHVPETVAFENAHIDDVQHLTGVPVIPLQLYKDVTSLYAARAKGWQAVDDKRIKFIVDTSLKQNIAHTPTIVSNDRISRLYDFNQQMVDPVASVLPVWYPQQVWPAYLTGTGGVPDELQQAMRVMHGQIPKMKLVVRRLHEAGVTVHLGTDTLNPFVVPGESFHEEMRNFADSGYTPEQVWQAATRGNGESLPMPDLGVLKEDAPADFLIFKNDPTKDLDAFDSLEAVVVDGRFYFREQLDDAILRYNRRFDNAMYKFVTMTVMRRLVRRIRPRDLNGKAPMDIN